VPNDCCCRSHCCVCSWPRAALRIASGRSSVALACCCCSCGGGGCTQLLALVRKLAVPLTVTGKGARTGEHERVRLAEPAAVRERPPPGTCTARLSGEATGRRTAPTPLLLRAACLPAVKLVWWSCCVAGCAAVLASPRAVVHRASCATRQAAESPLLTPGVCAKAACCAAQPARSAQLTSSGEAQVPASSLSAATACCGEAVSWLIRGSGARLRERCITYTP
jgi:hypothetical protein